MEQTKEFEAAVIHHQLMFSMYGPDHPQTIAAIQLVMLLAPLELFAEIEDLAHATKH